MPANYPTEKYAAQLPVTLKRRQRNQRNSKIPHPATGGQTAPIPGITRFSIPVHNPYYDSPNQEGIHQFDPKRAVETTQSSQTRLIQP